MTNTINLSESEDVSSFSELVGGVRNTFATGRTKSMQWRGEQLDGILLMLRQHQTEFVNAIREDLGRPTAEAFAADIGHATLAIKHLKKHYVGWSKPKKVFPGMMSLPGTGEIAPEPLGVALVISPWNYPIQLLLEPLAAAVAAGNCVVAKPSEMSPACTSVLARLIPQYLDEEAVVVVEGGVPETTELLRERFDHIFFTGSTNVGRVVMTAAAQHLTPVTLELGGKSPAVVAADSNVATAAKRIAWGKFLNAGQTCIAPDYVLVDNAVKSEFLAELRNAIESFYGSDVKSSPDLGRIVNGSHFSRLVGLLGGHGGEVVVGGDTDEQQRFIAPTVISDPSVSSPLMTEEIFGPILPVIGSDSISESIEFINGREKPLALYVFSESKTLADEVVNSTSSGGVCVNHALMHILPENLPFGGVGSSGMGAYHGKAGFDVFSHHKSIVRKPSKPDPALMYPPYDKWKERIIRRVFK